MKTPIKGDRPAIDIMAERVDALEIKHKDQDAWMSGNDCRLEALEYKDASRAVGKMKTIDMVMIAVYILLMICIVVQTVKNLQKANK